MTAQEAERRRFRAIELLKEGNSVSEVSEMLGVSTVTLYEWRRLVREQGLDGIRAKPQPGRPLKLSQENRQKLREMLLEGPRAHGFDTELWTCPRVQLLIRRKFGVDYHVDHLSRVLRELDLTPQRPKTRPVERDEDAIDEWLAFDFEQIKKKTRGLRAHLVFLDECGFSLTPSVKTTWAPIGETPVIPKRGHWSKVSAIGALSLSPRRRHIREFVHLYPNGDIRSEHVVGFLRSLLTEIRGPYYSVMGERYLRDVLETMGPYVDGLKFAGGSFALMPKKSLQELIDLAHKYEVYVSTGGWVDTCLRMALRR